MSISDTKKLQPGDEAYWNDPDDGACSRVYKIASIEHFDDDVVRIVDVDGSVLECFVRELS